MTSKRLFILLIGLICLVLALSAASVFFGKNYLERKTSEILSKKTETLVLQEQQKSLAQAKKDIEKFESLEAISKTIVPQEKDQARAIREIIKLADESGINITNVTFPSSSLGEESNRRSTGSGTNKTSGNQTTQLEPVDGVSGVFQLPISVQSDTKVPIPYENLLLFIEKLQNNRRTAHIVNFQIAPFQENRNLVTFNLTINAYVKP